MRAAREGKAIVRPGGARWTFLASLPEGGSNRAALLESAARAGVDGVHVPGGPSTGFLDAAERAGLGVLFELRSGATRSTHPIAAAAAGVAGHPALLGYALPAGRPRVPRLRERRLRRIADAIRAADSGVLVLCALEPDISLRPAFADGLVVDLAGYESGPREALARAQALAEELPLIVTAGTGEAASLARAAGCTGVIGAAPAQSSRERPPVSVVVCTHNGARTLGECLEAVAQLDYPDYETIVVDDGSTDRSAAIAEAHHARVVRTKRGGLARARNAGIDAATGAIVAFTDDDAAPHADWLDQLVAAFDEDTVAGAGGLNIASPGDGLLAACAAGAPGRANYMMRGGLEAEHLAGVNMAFRREALVTVGGFDARYAAAGDELDLCRRLRASGWRLVCAPGAVVFHHFRPSVRAYLRQQWRNGHAEALLSVAWPDGGPPPPPGPGWARPLAARPLPTKPYVGALLLAFLGRRAALAALVALAGDRAAVTAPPRGLPAWALTTLLYLLQPLARLGGRLSGSLGAAGRRVPAGAEAAAAEGAAFPPGRPQAPR